MFAARLALATLLTVGVFQARATERFQGDYRVGTSSIFVAPVSDVANTYFVSILTPTCTFEDEMTISKDGRGLIKKGSCPVALSYDAQGNAHVAAACAHLCEETMNRAFVKTVDVEPITREQELFGD